MKKYLLIAPLAIAIIASSCNKSQEKVSPAPPKPNVKATAFLCELMWDPIKQQCFAPIYGDCMPEIILVPAGPSIDWWQTIIDGLTIPTWSVPDIGLNSAQVAYFTTKYGVTSTELNSMGGYAFFDMLCPSALTETEFNSFVNDYTATSYWDEADSRLDMVFAPKSTGSNVTIEMNINIENP